MVGEGRGNKQSGAGPWGSERSGEVRCQAWGRVRGDAVVVGSTPWAQEAAGGRTPARWVLPTTRYRTRARHALHIVGLAGRH